MNWRVSLLMFSAGALAAQDIDTVVSPDQRKPFTFLDQIVDKEERQSFLTIYETLPRDKRLQRSEEFLLRYPRSWLLSFVHEIAAKAAIDLGLSEKALAHAGRSLRLFPENPLMLTPLARLYLEQQRFADASRHARDALDYLARFGRPATVEIRDWPGLKRQLETSAHYIAGRAFFSEALRTGNREQIDDAVSHLDAAAELDENDQDAVYLLGLAYLSLNQGPLAADAFSRAARLRGPLQTNAREQLRRLPAPQAPLKAQTSRPSHRYYAGSTSCRSCHPAQHAAWGQTGMARMFRTYAPGNVIADFSAVLPGDSIRTFVEQGRHFFSARLPDHSWRTFPVTHTIGSKWQQAYATKLPDGRIHVFPLQYNRLEKRWLNYWRLIDPPNSSRADPAAFHTLSTATEYRANCAPCHTSQLQGETVDTLSFREEGVNCEMCHGPSGGHVSAMTEGKALRKQPIDPPVDFRRISASDYNAICNQCHAQSAMHEPGSRGEMNYSEDGPTFFVRSLWRPFPEFSLRAFYKDGRFRETTFIGEAISRTKCFRRGGVTCGHCHNPHPADAGSNPTSLKFRENPDQMCLQCHGSIGPGHSRHLSGSDASRCVSCHMPRIMNSVMFMARTHQIDDIPNAEFTSLFGPADSPNACLACHKTEMPGWARTPAANLR